MICLTHKISDRLCNLDQILKRTCSLTQANLRIALSRSQREMRLATKPIRLVVSRTISMLPFLRRVTRRRRQTHLGSNWTSTSCTAAKFKRICSLNLGFWVRQLVALPDTGQMQSLVLRQECSLARRLAASSAAMLPMTHTLSLQRSVWASPTISEALAGIKRQ